MSANCGDACVDDDARAVVKTAPRSAGSSHLPCPRTLATTVSLCVDLPAGTACASTHTPARPTVCRAPARAPAWVELRLRERKSV